MSYSNQKHTKTVFSGKSFFDGKSLFSDGLPIFTNRATRQRPPDLQIHEHDFIEIAYIMFGEGRHLIKNETFKVSKGDLFIINPGVPHAFYSDEKYSDEEFLVCNIAFSIDLISEANLKIRKHIKLEDVFLYSAFFEKNNAIPYYYLKVTGRIMDNIEHIYENIHSEYMRKSAGYENMMFSYLMLLLTTIFRQLTGYAESSDIDKYKKTLIDDSIKYIDENYANPDLTMKDVAAKFFLNKNYFSKIFREFTNQKFSSYVLNKRISSACVLLKDTNHSITEIIEETGYRDVKYFNVIFKRATGLTPSEYRKRDKS